MRRVRVSVTLDEAVRNRFTNDAKARSESLDTHLGHLLMRGANIPEPQLVEELRQARAEAAVRARELGAARRQIRELHARLNALYAGPAPAAPRPPWSLDSSAPERGAWWRWLGAGVERLRERYRLVQLGYEEHGKPIRWWWESPARVRAVAIAVAWEEALDSGGESVPSDPRYGEAFLDYLWRLSSPAMGLVEVGRYYGPGPGDSGHPFLDRLAQERAAFRLHLAGVAGSEPVVI